MIRSVRQAIVNQPRGVVESWNVVLDIADIAAQDAYVYGWAAQPGGGQKAIAFDVQPGDVFMGNYGEHVANWYQAGIMCEHPSCLTLRLRIRVDCDRYYVHQFFEPGRVVILLAQVAPPQHPTGLLFRPTYATGIVTSQATKEVQAGGNLVSLVSQGRLAMVDGIIPYPTGTEQAEPRSSISVKKGDILYVAQYPLTGYAGVSHTQHDSGGYVGTWLTIEEDGIMTGSFSMKEGGRPWALYRVVPFTTDVSLKYGKLGIP